MSFGSILDFYMAYIKTILLSIEYKPNFSVIHHSINFLDIAIILFYSSFNPSYVVGIISGLFSKPENE